MKVLQTHFPLSPFLNMKTGIKTSNNQVLVVLRNSALVRNLIRKQREIKKLYTCICYIYKIILFFYFNNADIYALEYFLKSLLKIKENFNVGHIHKMCH